MFDRKEKDEVYGIYMLWNELQNSTASTIRM